MKTFDFHRPTSVEEAVVTADRGAGSYFAGGTNLLDLMKSGAAEPSGLISVAGLGLGGASRTESGGIRIGSTMTNSAVANHPLIRTEYPMLSQAILSGATTQIRNMATVGGNLLQRTRCPYFTDPALGACNKRQPGSGCSARTGFNREHALFGASVDCVAVHPSDMAVALAALDAVVHVTGPAGRRAIALADFYTLPGGRPERDTTVAAGELITAVELPPSPYSAHSWYLKLRDRRSYAFALVSVAVGLEMADGVIKSAALALGGVAAKPWRVPAAEAAMAGRVPDAELFRFVAQEALAGARPLSQNGFKLDLAKNSVVRALATASARR